MDWIRIPFTKKLSPGELEYLTSILLGYDRQLGLISEFMGSDTYAELQYMNRMQIDSFFETSGIRQRFNDLIQYNASTSEEFIQEFYRIGAELGYKDIEQTLAYTEADAAALFHVKEYNFNLISNVNNELRNQIKETIFQSIAEGEGYMVTMRKLMKLPLEPINNFSLRTRAEMIARTERARAVNTGTLQSYANYGVEKVDINTSHDKLVCDYCIGLEAGNPYSLSEAQRLLPAHPNCYMPDTEVYTDKGWKLIQDVDIEKDTVLTLNPETKLTEFIKPLRLFQHANDDGHMYHIHNKWFDICVTPEHDCFIYQRKMVNGVRGAYPEFRKPYNLNSESKFLRTVENDNVSPELINVNGLKFKPKDYAFFMAWYISEGSVLHNPETAKAKNYPIKITQEINENRRIIEPIFKDIADYLGIKLYIGKEYFEFHSQALHEYLVQLGKSHEKYIPKELFTLDKEALNIFLENYVLGDGHERRTSKYGSVERSVFTSSTKLRDDLSYLILLCGYYPSISLHSKAGTITEHKNGIYTQNKDVWGIRINTSDYATYSSCTVDKIEYTGDVVCLELPKYHTLWVKRNGKTSWNGNCRCNYSAHIPEPDSLDSFDIGSLSIVNNPRIVNLCPDF